MLYAVKLAVAQKMKLRKEAIRYASTMVNMSIKDGNSPYQKFFGAPSPITPETCVNFGRIGYATYANVVKNKYKPRASKCIMVRYAMNHSAHTYKYLNMKQENQLKLSLQGMLDGNIGIIHINLHTTDSPLLTKVEGLNEEQKALLEKAIDKFIINNKMYPK
jgi:hypothetical protein